VAALATAFIVVLTLLVLAPLVGLIPDMLLQYRHRIEQITGCIR
jgi:hypothetical protein